MNIKNHYETLGVRQDAEDAVIIGAHKGLSQKYHPDKYVGDPSVGNSKMAEINEARDFLLDPVKRSELDSRLSDERFIKELKEFTKKRAEQPIASDIDNENENNSSKRIGVKLSIFALITMGLFFWFRYLGAMFFYNLFSRITNYSGWAVVIVFVFFVLASGVGPKVDKRFKTGYKNNETPKPLPWWFLFSLIFIWFLSRTILHSIPDPEANSKTNYVVNESVIDSSDKHNIEPIADNKANKNKTKKIDNLRKKITKDNLDSSKVNDVQYSLNENIPEIASPPVVSPIGNEVLASNNTLGCSQSLSAVEKNDLLFSTAF